MSVRGAVVCALTLTVLAGTCTSVSASAFDKSGPSAQSVGCFSFFQRDFGVQTMVFCTSDHGNIDVIAFPVGDAFPSHIFAEGYAICDQEGVHGFDFAVVADGFEEATITQPNGFDTFPLTISRETSDGVYRFDQTYSWGRGPGPRAIVVGMTLTRIAPGVSKKVVVSRMADIDIRNEPDPEADALDDSAFRTADTAAVFEHSAAGLSLAPLGSSLNTPHATFIERLDDVLEEESFAGCTAVPLPDPAPATDDFVARLNFNFGRIPEGAKRTMQIRYARF